MAKRLVLLFVLAFGLLFSTCANAAEDSAGAPQTLCPILSGKIDKNIHTDYMGQRIYFCCAGCKVEFMKDPEKFIKKMEAQGIQLEKPQPAR